jgi:hypothetical protein
VPDRSYDEANEAHIASEMTLSDANDSGFISTEEGLLQLREVNKRLTTMPVQRSSLLPS